MTEYKHRETIAGNTVTTTTGNDAELKELFQWFFTRFEQMYHDRMGQLPEVVYVNLDVGKSILDTIFTSMMHEIVARHQITYQDVLDVALDWVDRNAFGVEYKEGIGYDQ